MTPSGKYQGISRQTVIDFLAGFTVSAMTLAVFLRSLGDGFIGWDDDAVFANPNIRSMGLKFFKWVFTTPVSYNYHPLTFISFALDYRLSGPDPAGYHLTNIVFHSLNAGLVFILALTLIRLLEGGNPKRTPVAIPAAFMAAFLFGIHPLRVESVVWVSERKDVLSAFFFLLSLIFHVRHVSLKSSAGYALSLVFFILALLSKPMAISLPFVLILLDYCLIDGFWQRENLKRILLEKIPFFLLSLVSVPVTLWAQTRMIQSLDKMPFAYRLATAARGYIFYLYKFLLPVRLVPFYPIPKKIDFFSAGYAGAALLFLFLTAFVLVVLRRRRVFTAVWLYYVITLIPVIGIVQVGIQAAADRYTYIPMIGLAIVAGVGGACLFRASNAPGRIALAAAGAVIAMTLMTLTYRQIGVWKDDVTLLTWQIDNEPNYLAYYNRAIAYSNIGGLARSVDDYSTAIRLYPTFRNAYLGRANVYARMGDYQSAAADYSRLIELFPADGAAYYYLGLLYSRAKKDDAAAYYMQKASELGFRAAPAPKDSP